MRCLSQALKQSLDLGYAHHIQRLMVIGNFALIAGLDVESVCDWYLGVYIDAYEWVGTNTSTWRYCGRWNHGIQALCSQW